MSFQGRHGVWIHACPGQVQGKSKTVDNKFTWGKYRGRALKSMRSEVERAYLMWVLSNPVMEDEWGDAIRQHLTQLGHKPKKLRPEETPIYFSSEVVDKFSLLFGDLWLRHVQETMVPSGILQFLETQAYFVFDNIIEGALPAKHEGSDYWADSGGIEWHFRDTWVSLKVLGVACQEDAEAEYDDPPF